MTTQDIERKMDADAQSPSADGLRVLRDAVRRHRALELEIADLEERLKFRKQERYQQQHETLPDLFAQYGATVIGVEAEGNAPPFVAHLRDYYRAGISSEWSQEQQSAAFALLNKMKLGDLIKRVVEIRFAMEEDKEFKRLRATLAKLKIPFAVRQTVPWNTLTSYVKERYKAGRPMSDAALRTLGATVGSVVELKQQKED